MLLSRFAFLLRFYCVGFDDCFETPSNIAQIESASRRRNVAGLELLENVNLCIKPSQLFLKSLR